jgi:hypothetical protein
MAADLRGFINLAGLYPATNEKLPEHYISQKMAAYVFPQRTGARSG